MEKANKNLSGRECIWSAKLRTGMANRTDIPAGRREEQVR